MELFTKIDIPESDFKIDYNSKIAFIGSCFAENISRRFSERKFHTFVNPLGTIYNPLSIENMMEKIATAECGDSNDSNDSGEGCDCDNLKKRGCAPCKIYTENDIFYDGCSWSSWDAHSSLSVKGSKDDASARTEYASKLNNALIESREFLSRADAVFITLGTAFVYFLKETGKVVSNCHKQNAALFERRLITVEEAAAALMHTVESLRKIKSDIRVIFTVSPLRHLNDGAHGNNLSKATLLLAVEKVRQDFAATSNSNCTATLNSRNAASRNNSSVALNCHDAVAYFPSYEIALDELRDYRYYAEDMVHLSTTAEEYIFEKMCATFCTEATIANMKRVEKFMRTVFHRIIDADSAKTAALAKQQMEQAKTLEAQIAGLNLNKEKEYYRSLL